MTSDWTDQQERRIFPDAELLQRYDPAQGAHALAPQRPTVSVNEPMTALWQGVEYPVAQWNVHGFELLRAIPTALSPGQGRVVDVYLLIGTGETRIQMRVQARLDAAEQSGLRYLFIDLGRAQAELLHRIVDTALSKQELSLTQLLNDAQDTRAARQETTQKTLAFRTFLQVSLACVALGAAAYAALGSMTTVKSRYAAVSAAAASVSVPASGMVTSIEVSEGQSVALGETLGYLRRPDHDDRTGALDDRIRALEAEQAELKSRQTALNQWDVYSTQTQEQELVRLEQAVALAQSRLSLERAQLGALHATGLPTLERQQNRARQQALVLSAEAELASARTALQVLEASKAAGLAPGLANGMTAGALSPEALELRLTHLTSEIALAYQRAEDLRAGTPVTSPCDCVVAQIRRVTGEWAEPAQPMFVMAQPGATAVHALVMADAAGRISQGDRATIRFANGKQVSGRVAKLSYDTNWSGFAGLQDSIFGAERYARVEVTPDLPLDMRIGMTGHVTIKTTNPMGWALGKLGL